MRGGRRERRRSREEEGEEGGRGGGGGAGKRRGKREEEEEEEEGERWSACTNWRNKYHCSSFQTMTFDLCIDKNKLLQPFNII